MRLPSTAPAARSRSDALSVGRAPALAAMAGMLNSMLRKAVLMGRRWCKGSCCCSTDKAGSQVRQLRKRRPEASGRAAAHCENNDERTRPSVTFCT